MQLLFKEFFIEYKQLLIEKRVALCHMSTAFRHAQCGILIQAIWTTSWSRKISIYRDRYAVRTQSTAGAWRWNVKLRVVLVETGTLTKLGVAFLKNCAMDLATVRHTGQTDS